MTSKQQDQYRDVSAADMEANRQAAIQAERDKAMVARESEIQRRQDEDRIRRESERRDREEAKKNAATEFKPNIGPSSGNVVENKKAPVTNPSSPPAETASAKVSPVEKVGTISGIPASEYNKTTKDQRDFADQYSGTATRLKNKSKKMAEDAKKEKEGENA